MAIGGAIISGVNAANAFKGGATQTINWNSAVGGTQGNQFQMNTGGNPNNFKGDENDDPVSHKIERWTNYVAAGTIIAGLGPEDPIGDAGAVIEEGVGQTGAGVVWTWEKIAPWLSKAAKFVNNSATRDLATDLWTSVNLASGAHGKGERNQARNSGGTNNRYKKLKPDPNNDKNVLEKDSHTGRTISKPKPPGFDEYWKNKR